MAIEGSVRRHKTRVDRVLRAIRKPRILIQVYPVGRQARETRIEPENLEKPLELLQYILIQLALLNDQVIDLKPTLQVDDVPGHRTLYGTVVDR